MKAILKLILPVSIWNILSSLKRTKILVGKLIYASLPKAIALFPHRVYRLLFFDDCPNWQKLSTRTIYRFREFLNKKNLPYISSQDRDIVNGIIKDGVYLTSLNQIGFEKTDNFRNLASQLFEDTLNYFKVPPTHLGGLFTPEKFTLRPPVEYILEKYPEIYRFALNERLVSVAQHYIGAPACLLDVDFKIDLPGGNDIGSKLWHYDEMNYKILKIFIYFSNVTKSNPAFEYISSKSSLDIKERIFKEDEVYNLTERKNIVRVEAPAESVLFLGVDRILHHISIPTHNEEKAPRKAVVFHYLSQKVPSECERLRNGAAVRWGTDKAKKLLKDFAKTLPEETRKYLYIHS